MAGLLPGEGVLDHELLLGMAQQALMQLQALHGIDGCDPAAPPSAGTACVL